MNKNTIILVDDDLTINYFHKRLLKTYFEFSNYIAKIKKFNEDVNFDAIRI